MLEPKQPPPRPSSGGNHADELHRASAAGSSISLIRPSLPQVKPLRPRLCRRRTDKILTIEAVKASDVVITMGCGDTCPFYPGKRYEDRVLEDPAGNGVDAVRPIRDEIRRRVENLITELVPTNPR